MEVRISPRLTTVLEYAREEAMRTGCYAIAVDHLTLGILRDGDNDACRSLTELGIRLSELKSFIDSRVLCSKIVPFGDSDKIGVSRGAESAINMAALEALKAGVQEVSASHLLMAITRLGGNAGQAFLAESGITPEILSAHMKETGVLRGGAKKVTPSPEGFTHVVKLSRTDTKIFS